MVKFLISFLIVLSSVCAKDHYISQSGIGGADGSSAANARAVSWLNTSGNWGEGAGKVSAGDTVRLAGTISSPITVHGSGAAGKPITILFETGAKLSGPGLRGNWITVDTKDYITIDGGASGIIGGRGANLAGANGVIENTDNGTGRGNQVNTTGIFTRGCRHIIVRNLVIRNLYVRTDIEDMAGEGHGFYMDDDNRRGINNHLISNCHLNDMRVGVAWEYGPNTSDLTMNQVTTTRVNFGGRCGGWGAGVSGTRLNVTHCWIYDFLNWDNYSKNDKYHHDGFFIWAVSGATWAEANFVGNIIGPHYTTYPGGYNSATAGIFTQGGIAGPINIYNNTFPNDGKGGPSDGIVSLSTTGTGVFRVLNNTFIGGTGANQLNFSAMTGGKLTILIRNNIFTGPDRAIGSLFRNGVTINSSHNLGYRLVANPFSWGTGGDGGGISLASWKSATKQDANWITANPRLTETYRLVRGSPAIGAGENLSQYFSTDAAGNSRPASGPWDVGAFMFGEGVEIPPDSSAPRP